MLDQNKSSSVVYELGQDQTCWRACRKPAVGSISHSWGLDDENS